MDGARKPERQRFQFSIRRLMLWTVVVAIYLGIVVALQLELSVFVGATVWFVIVGILRVANYDVAFLASVVAGVVLYEYGLYTDIDSFGGWTDSFVLALLIGALGGSVLGCFLFVFVQGGFRFVDWADMLIGRKG